MQMQFVPNEDGTITLYSKQFIKLCEFGITLPNAKSTDVEQEITLNVSLTLTKSLPDFVKVIKPNFYKKESGNNL